MTRRRLARPLSTVLVIIMILTLTPRAEASGVSVDGSAIAKIDAYVAEMVKQSGIPGAALALVKGDQTVFSKGYGVSNLALNSPVAADTAYGIGSITKSFTALAILQLRDQGLVDLDAPVQCYLPWFRVADEQASRQITIRHLLNHTSGLPGNSHGLVWNDPAVIRPSIEQAVRALKDVKLRHPVGSSFEYANMGYATLGLVIEKLSSQRYEDYLQRQILDHLGMRRSTADNDRAAALADTAKPYWWPFGRLSQSPLRMGEYMAPAGDMFLSSANDMARYVRFQLGYQNLISASTLAEWHNGGVAVDPQSGSYQMGLFNSTLHGHKLVQHGGDATGSSAIMMLLPDDDIGVVLLMGASAPQTPFSIGTGVLSIILGEEPPAAVPPNPWITIGRLSLLMALAAFLLLLGLPVCWFARRRRNAKAFSLPKGFVIGSALVLCLATVFGWFWVMTTAFSLGIPVPWGVYGWPLDIALGFGGLLIALTLWSLYLAGLAMVILRQPLSPTLPR
ncbi:MAG: serine hydrolase domain-containing protein [Bacillota bacterium]